MGATVTLAFARRGMFCAAILGAALALGGCSTAPKTEAQQAAQRQVLQERVAEKLGAAEQAIEQGQAEQAWAHLDGAIRLDPAAKQPWLKKAQLRFDARQYGEAITYAHEVLQRDVNDLTAKSILAVSGLRVSAQALDELRKANEVNGSARSEAEMVAKLIREVLGEPILVPNGVEPETRPARRVVKPRRDVAPSAAPAVAAAAPVATVAAPPPAAVAPRSPAPVATRPAPAANASAGRGNPFGALQ